MKAILSILLLFTALQGFAQHPWLPAIGPEDQIISRSGYTLRYNEWAEQADWVAYRLTPEMIQGTAKRKNNFRQDPLVTTDSASPDDYRNTGYDRGHLAPAADMKLSQQLMSDSFYMSNISPQLPGFNRGVWRKLEAQVRTIVMQKGTLLVVTGPVFDGSPVAPPIGTNRVQIPDGYFKALIDLNGETAGIAFILPHRPSKAPLSRFCLSINRLEQILNLNLFEGLPDPIEEALEAQCSPTKWGLQKTLEAASSAD